MRGTPPMDTQFLPVGIYRNVPYQTYNAHPGMRSTLLKVLLDGTPADLKHAMDNPLDKETPALIRGELLHAMLLEPLTVHDRFVMVAEPLKDKRSGADKKAWETYKAMAKEQDKQLIDYPMVQQCNGMADAVRKHPRWKNIADFADKELTLIAKLQDVLCKVRLDAALLPRSTGGGIFDIKTMEKPPTTRNITKAIVDYSYHLSTAMYVEVAKAAGLRIGDPEIGWTGFSWIWIQSKPPYHVRITDASQALLETGTIEFYDLLKSVKTSMDSGVWPGYGDRIDQTDLPSWYFNREYYFMGDDHDDSAENA